MARMTLHDSRVEGRDPRALRVSDPAVGSGRMLLHASNCSLSLWGPDLDPLAVALCQVNGALYAPWLSFPLPAGILGTQPEPTPSPLSAPEPLPEAVSVFRVDDRAQGLLFEW
jgi:hypothetical protein